MVALGGNRGGVGPEAAEGRYWFVGLVTALGEGWEGMETVEGSGCQWLEEDMLEGVGRGRKGPRMLHC